MTIAPTDQMLANFKAVAAWRGLAHRLETFSVACDRVYSISWGATDAFDALVEAGALKKCTRSFHRLPQEVLDEVRQREPYKEIGNYRGRLGKITKDGKYVFAGDQWIIYHMGSVAVVEMDVDEESPVDVVGILGHLWRVMRHKITGRKTDPFQIAAMLERGGLVEA